MVNTSHTLETVVGGQARPFELHRPLDLGGTTNIFYSPFFRVDLVKPDSEALARSGAGNAELEAQTLTCWGWRMCKSTDIELFLDEDLARR